MHFFILLMENEKKLGQNVKMKKFGFYIYFIINFNEKYIREKIFLLS